MKVCILHILGANAEIEALKKVVALVEKKQPRSRLFARSTRPGSLKLNESFRRPWGKARLWSRVYH